ncbi:uncharacterized protein LOC143275740 [Babylonia areolata]|uniref:uncharacterized protein LOC143275740 n=1 Tax=Babylonia areolata TaxID=304850 RepID=UPI003FD653E3
MTTPTTVAQLFPMGWYVAPTLPVFTGEPGKMSAEDFITEGRRVLAAYTMGDEMAAYFIYSHLQGTARRELMLRDLEETNTPEKVINILLGVFGDGRRVTTLLSTFFSRKQLPEESTLDYSHALCSMGRIIRTKRTGALTAEMLRDHFIDGLRNLLLKRELRRVVTREPHTTFIQARDEALRLQRELEEDQQQQQAREETAQLGDKLLLLEESLIRSLGCMGHVQVPWSQLRLTGLGNCQGQAVGLELGTGVVQAIWHWLELLLKPARGMLEMRKIGRWLYSSTAIAGKVPDYNENQRTAKKFRGRGTRLRKKPSQEQEMWDELAEEKGGGPRPPNQNQRQAILPRPYGLERGHPTAKETVEIREDCDNSRSNSQRQQWKISRVAPAFSHPFSPDTTHSYRGVASRG